LFAAFRLAIADFKVDIIRIDKLFLFLMLESLEEPGLGMLDLKPGRSIRNLWCSMFGRPQLGTSWMLCLRIDRKFVADQSQGIDQPLGVDIDLAETLVDREP